MDFFAAFLVFTTGIAYTHDWATDILENRAASDPLPRYLKALPCAHVDVVRGPCGKPGTQGCSACKLVSYCSKVSPTSKRQNITRLVLIVSSSGMPEETLELPQSRYVFRSTQRLAPNRSVKSANKNCVQAVGFPVGKENAVARRSYKWRSFHRKRNLSDDGRMYCPEV